MGSAAVAWARVFEMEVCNAQFWGHVLGLPPLGPLSPITLPRVCLEMLLVDTLGLTPFLSFILALSLTFGVFWCPQLLEEHPLIDLPGPK